MAKITAVNTTSKVLNVYASVPVAVQALLGQFRVVDDAIKMIRKIGVRVQELRRMLDHTERQVTAQVKAGMMLQINLPGVKLSPAVEPSDIVKVADRDGLTRNYGVIKELWETRQSLDAMEAKIRSTFSKMAGQSANRAIEELNALKKSVDKTLEDAFIFIGQLANSHLPEKLSTFATSLGRITEKSIAYEEAYTYNYVFEHDGDLVFAHYLQMKRVTDDDGNYHPNFYFTLCYKVGESPAMYVSVMPDFVPPSERLMLRQVKTVKEAVRALNILLNLDQFANSFGSIPVEELLRDRSITKDLFLFQNQISTIEVDSNQMVFHLKATVTDKEIVNKISYQLMKELQEIVGRKGLKIRPKIVQKDRRWKIGFFFVSTGGALLVVPSDLEGLQQRFNLSDIAVSDIVKTINSGRPL